MALALCGVVFSLSSQAADDTGLSARYAAELTRAIENQWVRPDNLPDGQVCPVAITQIPGGTVVDLSVEADCPYDEAGKRSIKTAVLKAQPLPYLGFESVFRRKLELRFAPSSHAPVTELPLQPGVAAQPLPPECAAMMSVTYQPPQDALVSMLKQRIDIPRNTQLRLALYYTIDAGGNPVNVSIAQSSHDRDVDRAARDWGRGVRLSAAPGCNVDRVGILPMVLVR
jgi:hypothetical protein